MAIAIRKDADTLPPMRWSGEVDELGSKQEWRRAIMWEICGRAARPEFFRILALLKGVDPDGARLIASHVDEMMCAITEAACSAAEGLRHVGAVPESRSEEEIERLVCRVFKVGFSRIKAGAVNLEPSDYEAIVDRAEAAKYQAMNRRLEAHIYHDEA